MHPKSLQELVSSYHDTVGKNAFWLLDWTPNQTGVLRPDHIARYQRRPKTTLAYANTIPRYKYKYN